MIAALTFTLALLTTSTPASLDNDFESALGAAGLSTKTARFDPTLLGFYSEPRFDTPLYRAMHANPWRIPFLSDMWKRQLKVSVGDPGETVSVGARMLGQGTRRNLLGNPIKDAIDVSIKPGALKATLDVMKKRGMLPGPIPNLSGVPAQVQEAASLILQVAMQTIPYRRAALSQAPNYPEIFQRALKDDVESADPEQNQRDLAFYRRLDMKYLYAAGSDLVAACKHAQISCQLSDPETRFRTEFMTDWGKVILSGGTDDTYKSEPTLLIIDTGGNDTYLDGASNQTPNNWLSTIIDVDGKDQYLSDPALASTTINKFAGRKKVGSFGPASACFGVSVVIDSAGNDLYRSHRPGLGSAFAGVSYLEDSTGDDIYDSYGFSQGCGRFGVGVMEDWKGTDQYRAFNASQGFGGVAGSGILMDRFGDDRYTAENELIDFPSPQSKDHNVSLCQGAASGRRADYIDGNSLSGGVGILMDETGDDQYTCGVFGQGVGYWEGVGMLWDDAGLDKYTGQWYVQGASAHFAIGYLNDESGNDLFVAKMNMAQGAGHDFGVGMLMDEAGTDRYEGPNLSMGAGHANGMGVLIDLFGDDAYVGTGIHLGQAAEAQKGSMRERALCLGLLMDLGGNDSFSASATWAGNARRQANWVDRRVPTEESQVGVFWDR